SDIQNDIQITPYRRPTRTGERPCNPQRGARAPCNLEDHMPKTADRKRKYNEKTAMLAVRVPVSLHEAVKKKARRDRKPKSETVVDMLSAAVGPAEPKTESVFE